jgi:capsular polysaccharide biosynthesis protein
MEAPEVVLKMVSESTLLIGQYGAGLSHSMWLSKGSNVIEISAPSGNPMAPWAYRRLAESGSINFITSMCQSTWTSPASIAEFERAYSEIRSRRWTVFDTMRSVFQAYSHIYIGRILISAGLRKH